MDQCEQEKRYFISYSREDLDIARQLREDLEKQGFEIWMDGDGIIVGSRWDDSIAENIKRSIGVLYLVSPRSRSSSIVLHELEYAKTYKKNIIPLWVRGDKWSEVVASDLFSREHFDLRGERYKTGINRLIQILKDLSDLDARFTSYLKENDDDFWLQEVEDISNQSLTNQRLNKERKMPEDPEDTDKIYPPQRNPYKGLRAFEYKDKKDFFGRENLICEMIGHVKNLLSEEKKYSQVPRCMMVVGASGSGKSSVVMAGLLPALEDKENIPEVNRWFFLEPVRPGEYPMNALAQTLRLPFLNKKEVGNSPLERWNRANLRRKLDESESCGSRFASSLQGQRIRQFVQARLTNAQQLHPASQADLTKNERTMGCGLNELLRTITTSPYERIVLIVDQFEEIFAPTVNSDQREQFINLLMATATEPGTPILLLFTLRADFYHHILDNETLYRKLKRHKIDIPPMTREEVRAVIEEPVQRLDVNVTFDPYLAEDLLHEVRQRPESLPLLQFTLEQLFEDREGQRLTQRSYDKIGGLQGAINEHAEDIYKHELHTPQHRAEARKLFTEYFIYIPEAHDDPSRLELGEGITRRRVTQAELQLNALQSSIRTETINAFVKARLLTATSTVRQSTDLDNITDITHEISHEALINVWGRLRGWIKEDRKDICLMQSYRQRIKQWDEEKNPKKKRELLVEKLPLQQLREYGQRKKLDSLAEEFLNASLAQQRRQKIRVYLSSGITAIVILSLVLALIFRNMIFPPPLDPTVVTSLGDSGPGTIVDAIQRASNGATITFDARLSGQTIYLTHRGLDINKSITLRGPVGRINISSGNNTGHYIAIESGRNVTIENMTFPNSYTLKHSIIENAGNLTINNSTMSDNKSYSDAGAIYNTGTLILNHDILEGNKVSTDGGAIHNLYGTVSLNDSTISGNEAQGNGGGIYSQGGVVTVSRSHILNNRADNNVGGGIEIVNGSFSMNDTEVKSNHSDYMSGGVNRGLGGGIAIVGSVAFITSSVIAANTASAKGGGIVVAKNIGNGSSSLVKLQDIIPTNNQSAIHYIGQNTGGNIAGDLSTTGTTLQVLDDKDVYDLGSPAPINPVEKSSRYLGVADINGFCLNKGGSYGKISKPADPSAKDIMFTCFNQSNQDVGTDFSGEAICQSQYSGGLGVNTVIDRMTGYSDPASLQCYKNLKRLGVIGRDGFDTYCASQPEYTGLFDNSQYRQTAYDWLCQPKDKSKLPTGLSVSDACSLQYKIQDAVDRLANYNSIDGWECWEPV